jgi:hypothetical protein
MTTLPEPAPYTYRPLCIYHGNCADGFGADVSAIAKLYGGGGHRNAAGFTMPIGWEGDAQ